MLEIKNTKIYGLERAVIRSGFPRRTGSPPNFNSRSDATIADMYRAQLLGKVKPGSGHDNYLKGIIVQCDLKYSLYITKQLQRYSFLDIISSQSTMYSLTERGKINDCVNKYVSFPIIVYINELIKEYNHEKLPKDERYKLFMKIISNLPSGYEQWMGISTNYLQLKTIYHQRKGHKLTEDYEYLVNWIVNLPHFKALVLGEVQ